MFKGTVQLDQRGEEDMKKDERWVWLQVTEGYPFSKDDNAGEGGKSRRSSNKKFISRQSDEKRTRARN